MHGDETTVVAAGPTTPVTAWAGPWPIEERWWEPSAIDGSPSSRFLTWSTDREAGDSQHGYLVIAEHRRWWISARYD